MRSLGTILHKVMTEHRIEELLKLIEAAPEGLQTAEFMVARDIVRGLAGKTIAAASLDETRVTIETADGARYFFYGFLGSQTPS
jgi:hypothetical protein